MVIVGLQGGKETARRLRREMEGFKCAAGAGLS
jgi:hypothetical protein